MESGWETKKITFYEQTPRCTGHLRSRTRPLSKTEHFAGFKQICLQNFFNWPDLLQTIWREALVVAVLDDLVGVHDDGDEEGEDDVDEEADEEVEVDSAAIIGND